MHIVSYGRCKAPRSGPRWDVGSRISHFIRLGWTMDEVVDVRLSQRDKSGGNQNKYQVSSKEQTTLTQQSSCLHGHLCIPQIDVASISLLAIA
jgi:hypothetical protein